MSINSQKAVTCPKCSQLSEVTVWHSITVKDSPDLKAELLKGNINVFRCDMCGTQGLLPEPLLYHDEDKRLLISFSPTNDEEKKKELFKEVCEVSKTSGELENYKEYNLRFVSDMNDLMEKILIFDAGLLDKVIEIIKLMILMQDEETASHRCCRFGKRGGGELEFMVQDTKDGMIYTSRVPESTYETIYKQVLLSGVKPYSFGWELVDPEYASRLLGGVNNY